MKTRIRELRKARGFTLQQLAKRIGTTPQTVQRLETQNMTVSTDWLEKFAAVFDVHPADLLWRDDTSEISYLGDVGLDGLLYPGPPEQFENFQLNIPAHDPIAVRLSHAAGPYARGTYLVGDKLPMGDLSGAHEKDCLISIKRNQILVRRALLNNASGGEPHLSLIPYDVNDITLQCHSPQFIAKIILTVHYLC